MPFFSVIIPTYNRESFIKKTVQSVINQDFTDFEVVVVDDGGKDRTKEAVLSLEDDRVKYYWKENGERGAARNYGIKKATGKYICFLDSDDYYLNNHLSTLHKAYLATHKKAFHCSYFIQSGSQQSEVHVGKNHSNMFPGIAYYNQLSINGISIERELLLEHLFSEDRRFVVAEDLCVWLKIGCRVGIHQINIPTTVIVQHDQRSMALPSPEVIGYCTQEMLKSLRQDRFFSDNFQYLIPAIEANQLSLQALSHSMLKERLKAITLLAKAISLNTKQITNRRTLGIIKHILF